MKHRKLRIAWSVAWGIVAVLLIALWVRSYWWVDLAFFKVGNDVLVLAGSMPGAIDINIVPEESIPLGMYHQPSDEWMRAQGRRKRPGFLIDSHAILAPYWFWLLMPAIVAAIPWLPWWSSRFSLRTLLIAMTLVAVGLGLIVWLAR
jgi:hypothetical protein